MPSLKDALGQDLGAYEPADTPSAPPSGPPEHMLGPGLNPFLRCPLPPIYTESSDASRQFYQGGLVPQFRLLSPSLSPPTSGGSSTTTISGTGSSSGGGSGGGGTPVTPVQPTAQTVSVTSVPLGPGGSFSSSAKVSKCNALLRVATNTPARVQLYGTAQALAADGYRGLDVPPPAGTVQNIICDVVLDTAPYQWSFQDRIGANADNPQTTALYVKLTNLDNTTDQITMTLTYVPLES